MFINSSFIKREESQPLAFALFLMLFCFVLFLFTYFKTGSHNAACMLTCDPSPLSSHTVGLQVYHHIQLNLLAFGPVWRQST